jgi:hypothetical protein
MSHTPRLEQLALAKFGPLSEAEMRLLRAAPNGDTAYCGPSENSKDPANLPSHSDGWDKQRNISAALLRWLCSDQVAKDCIDPRGIHIYAARIQGSLDLSFIEIPFPLVFLRCHLTGHFNLDVTEIPDLELTGTSVEKLSAEYATVKGCIVLKEGFHSTGPIELTGVQIGGNLECNGGKFINPPKRGVQTSGDALNAENAKITGDVLLRDGFSAKGSVWFSGAEIGGNLECWGGKFINPPLKNRKRSGAAQSGMALNAGSIRVHGDVLLSEEFYANGKVTFDGAQIGGGLDCDGGKFENPARKDFNDSGTALSATCVKVTSDIYLRDKFSAKGEVNLDGAQIGGSLNCDEGTFENPPDDSTESSGIALTAENVRVGGDIFLRGGFSAGGGFSAKGEVNLDGAQIGGVFDCDGGKFENPAIIGIEDSGTALKARSIRVNDSVFLGSGFSATGSVDLDGAQIEGILECERGMFESSHQEGNETDGVSLNARFIRVGDSVFLRNGFCAKGAVKLDKARIARRLELDDGTFKSLDLIDSFVGSIVDDEAGWPNEGNLSLDGFVYERISGGPIEAIKRLEWLKRQAGFTRQPYRQLAKVLKEAGDDDGWRKVCIEMERRSWKLRRGRLVGKSPNGRAKELLRTLAAAVAAFFLEVTIGYGYKSMRAIYGLLAVSLVGAFFYFIGFQVGSMLPTDKENYATFTKNRSILAGYEKFHVLAYSAENAFPPVKLGMQDKWEPSPDIQAPPDSSAGWIASSLRSVISPGFLRWFRWGEIAAGWFLTTFFVVGVTGLAREK